MQISHVFVSKDPIDNKARLVQVIAQLKLAQGTKWVKTEKLLRCYPN